MAGDLAQFVTNALQKTIAKSYPHLKLPAIVAAAVTTAKPLSDGWTEYSIQILTESGSPNPSYPEIPGVRAKLTVETGRTVAVGLLYGMLTPVLLCEVQL